MKHIALALVALLALLAVACGGTDGLGDVVGTAEVSAQNVQDRIFTPYCATIGCHVGLGAPMGLDLSAGEAYSQTVGVPSVEVGQYFRIDPFNPGDSYVYMKVTNDSRILGDQMPAGGRPPLSSQNLQLLENWIEQGATQ